MAKKYDWRDYVANAAPAKPKSRLKPKPKPAVPATRARPDSYVSPKERREVSRQQRINERRSAAADKLERAGMHKQAKQLRAGLPITRGFAGRIGDDIQTAAIGFPGGVYQIGKAVGQDVSDIGHGRVGRRQGHKPFAHTGGIAEALGKQYAKDYRHPLRHLQQHPGFFAMDAAAVASLGAGTAARAGAAGRALSEGGVKAALKAGAKKPIPPVRTHTYRGANVRGRYSTNPAVAALQKRADHAGKDISPQKFERLISEQRRIEKASANAPALRAQSTAAPRVRSDIMRRFGKHRADTVEEAAIRVVAEGVPLDEVIAAHKAQAGQVATKLRNKRRGGVPGKGYTYQQSMRLSGHRRDLLRRAAIYEEARKYLDVDAAGEPIISAAHPKLLEKYNITRTAALTRQGRAQRSGLLSYEAAERRIQAPGAKMTSATRTSRPRFEDRPRTLGEAQAHVAKLEAKVSKVEQGIAKMLMARNPDKYPGGGKYIGARPSDIAKGRPTRQVSEIEKGSYRSGYRRRAQDPTIVGDVLESAGQGKLHAKPKTGAELALEDAQKYLAAKAAEPNPHPSIRAYKAADDELSALKGKVEKVTEPEFMRETRTFEASRSAERQVPDFETQLRTVRERKGKPGITIEDGWYARLQQHDPNLKQVIKRDASGEPVGILHVYLEDGKPNLLSVVTKEGQRRQGIATELYRAAEEAGFDIRAAMGEGGYTAEGAAFANRFEQQRPPPGDLGTVSEFKGMTTPEEFAGGKFRVPDVLHSKPPATRVTETRGGVERTPGTFTHEYTGALRETGGYTMHPVRAVAEDALHYENWADRNRFRKKLVQVGSKERPPDSPRFVYHGRQYGGKKYVPVKTRDLSRSEARDLRRMLESTELENLTPNEAMRIEESLRRYERELFPDPAEYAHVPVGQGVEGVVWVDSRLMKSQKKIIGRIPVIDEASDIVKGLILYAKPGYVAPNVIGNIGYNLFQQGILMPRNFNRAVRLPRDLDFMVKEMMGSGYSRSLAEGTMSPASFAVHKAADFWSKFVDDPFRKSAFIHEARRYGFKTDDELRSLIMDGQHEGIRGEITQRARDAIVDYERMGPVERDLIRRVLFVYPWLKGSTYYAAQFLRDHPIQAAVFARIGQYGESKALEELGPLPAWARGSFKVGGTEDEPQIINPQSVSPWSTPAQLLQMAKGSVGNVERSEQIGEATNPILQSGVEAAFGRDLFTGKELKGGYAKTFLGQIGKGLPQYNLYRRGGLNFLPGVDEHTKEGATYPYTPSDAREQFVFGSAFPRPANIQALNEQAVDKSATKLDQLKAERAAVVPKLPKEFTPEDKAYVRRAYKIATGMEELREKTSKETGEGEPYYRAVLEGEARYMHSLGVFDDEDLKWLVKLAKTGTYDEVRKRRNALVQGPYEDIYLTAKRNARKAVGYEAS